MALFFRYCGTDPRSVSIHPAENGRTMVSLLHTPLRALARTALLLGIMCCCACSSLPAPEKTVTDADYYEKALEFFKTGNYFEAIPAFEELREKFPLSPYAVQSELRLGESHYRQEQYTEAIHYFENFRRLHPSNPQVPYSLYMNGMCAFQQVLSVDRDQTAAREAVEHFRLLVDLFPQSPYAGRALSKISEAESQIAGHELFVGRFYAKQGLYTGAIDRFSNILKYYPCGLPRDEVMFYLAEALLLSGDTARGRRMLELLQQHFPGGDYSAEAGALLQLHSGPVPADPSPSS